jgi:hypothetical protein
MRELIPARAREQWIRTWTSRELAGRPRSQRRGGPTAVVYRPSTRREEQVSWEEDVGTQLEGP